MEYPYTVKLKSPAIAKKAKVIAKEMSETREKLEVYIDELESLRKKLWVLLDKDENINASSMAYTYNGEDHTVTCEGKLKATDSVVEGLMKMMAVPPSKTRH